MLSIIEKFVTAATGPDPKNQKALQGSIQLGDRGFLVDTIGAPGLFL